VADQLCQFGVVVEYQASLKPNVLLLLLLLLVVVVVVVME